MSKKSGEGAQKRQMFNGENAITEKEALAILQLSPFFSRLAEADRENLLQDFYRRYVEKENTESHNVGQLT